MAIFNEKKGSEPLQNAASSPEEEKLIASMAQLEDQKTALYAEIGKAYYESNPEDPQGEDMASRFHQVGELDEQYQDFNNQLRTLRGITTCEQCGADILVTDTFCKTCGARIISEITVSPNGGICPSCGRRVTPGQMFCSTCGAKITISESVEDDMLDEATQVYGTPEGEAEAPIPEEGNPAPEEKRVCPNCGRELDEGVQFCMFCGKPVETPFAGDGFPDDSDETAGPASAASGEFCPNCGAPLQPGDIFCIQCGQKVG